MTNLPVIGHEHNGCARSSLLQQWEHQLGSDGDINLKMLCILKKNEDPIQSLSTVTTVSTSPFNWHKYDSVWSFCSTVTKIVHWEQRNHAVTNVPITQFYAHNLKPRANCDDIVKRREKLPDPPYRHLAQALEPATGLGTSSDPTLLNKGCFQPH